MNPTITVSPNIIFKRLGEEVILINLDTDRIFSLNQTGAKTWELIENTSNLDLVKKGLLEEFDVSPDVLESELDRILTALVIEGFVSID